MFPTILILVACHVAVSAALTLNVTGVSKASISDGYTNDANRQTTVTIDTPENLSDVTFYIDHGDGQRESGVTLTQKQYKHKYSRRGRYKGRVTIMLTSDSSYESVEYDVEVGKVLITECYPAMLVKDVEYTLKYTHDDGGEIKSKTSDFTPDSGTVDHDISKNGETIDNPCNSKALETKVDDNSIYLTIENNPVVPHKNSVFKLYGASKIRGQLSKCKVDFGDLIHSGQTNVPNNDPIKSWSHSYMNVGVYSAKAYCWNSTTFTESNTVTVNVNSFLSLITLSADNPVVDFYDLKDVRLILKVDLDGADDILDTSVAIDWKDGTTESLRIFRLAQGDYVIPKAHSYTSIGSYHVVADLKRSNTDSQSKTVKVAIAESLSFECQLVQVDGSLRTGETLKVKVTNIPTYDARYIVDYGDSYLHPVTYSTSDFSVPFSGFPALEFYYNFGGKFTISVTVSNDGFTRTRTISVEIPQGAPKYVWDLTKKNSDVVIIDESTVGFKMKYNVDKNRAPRFVILCSMDYGDGFNEDLVNITFGDVDVLPWTHNFVTLGPTTVTMTCKNTISSHDLTLDLKVLTYTQDDYKLTYDNALGVDGTLATLNTVKTKFEFDLMGVKEVFPHLVTWTFGDNTPRMSRIFISYEESYLYEKRGLYNGFVVVWSPKGNFTYNFNVFIGVTNLTMSPTGGVKNTTFGFSLREVRGKSFSGKVSYGDGSSNSKSCPGVCNLQHRYTRHDFFDVQTEVKVGGIVEKLTFPKGIFVDNPVNGLEVWTTNVHIQQPPGRVVVKIGMINGSLPVNYMLCAIDLGDELNRRIYYLEGSLSFGRELVFKSQYMSLGQHNVIVNCSNRAGEEVATTTCYTDSECFGGDGIFERMYADPKLPLLIMASTEVEITSRTILLCVDNPLNFTWSLWTLHESSYDRDVEIEIEQPNRDAYRIRKGFLDPNLYSLELNVSTVKDDMVHWLHGLTYIRIMGSPLIVEFKGGSIRATGNEKAVVNAALMSRDPDKANRGDYTMTFTWNCRYYFSDSVAELELAVLRYDPGFEINCDDFSKEIRPGIRMFDNLPDERRGYLYEVSAQSGTKSSEEDARSYIQYTKGAPDIAIECLLNCEVKRARTTAQLMEVVCPFCFKDEFYSAELTWTLTYWVSGNLYSEVPNIEEITDYIDDNPVAIILKKNTLDPCQKYRLKVHVVMEHREEPGEAFSDFTVNCPPSRGTCTTTPTRGVAKNTNFRTTCTGWLDDGYGPMHELKPLAFIYKFYISFEEFFMPLYQGAQALTPLEPLPVIPGSKGGKYTIISRIYDVLNDYAEFNTTVDLIVPVLHSLDEIGSAQQALISSGVAKDTSTFNKQLVMTTYSSSILQTVEVNSMNTFLDEYTGSEHAEANKDASFQNVFDKFMASRRDKDMKTEISGHYRTFINQINDKWTNATALDGHGLESFGEALATIMHQRDTVDYELSEQGNELLNSGTFVLESLSRQEPFPIQDKVDDVVFAMAGALDTIYNKNTPTYQTEDTPLDINVPMSEDEIQMLKFMVLNEQAERDEETKIKGRAVVETVENSTQTLLAIMLKDQTKGQRAKTIKREGVSLTARKITGRSLKDTGFEAEDFAMEFPGAHNDSMNFTDPISLKASVTKKNLFSYAADGSSYDITSPVLSIRVHDENGTDYFDGNITLRIKRANPGFTVFKANDTRHGEEGLFHHQFQVKKTTEITFVFVDIGRVSGDVGAYIRYEKPPVTYADDAWYVKGEFMTYDSSSKRKKRGINTVVKFAFGPGELQKGFVYFALDFGDVADSIKEYSFVAYSDGCRVWDGEKNVWSNESCKISPFSTPAETLCNCVEAPGHNFASSFYVAPNLIDFDIVFGKFNAENAAVYGTLIGLFVVFGIAAVWAKRKGRMDEKKWGVGYLKDNFVEDHYFYLLTVHTGLTGSSGTKSLVSFIITGQKGDTGVRLLSDGVRYLETGAVMTFIMATSECLGNLKFLRIWHDNSGEGAEQSWYLCKLVVEDIQKNTRSVFVCDDWLALDKSDGIVDRVIPVAFEDDLMSFSKLFSEHNRVNISDTHLWLSILLRPEKSMFTRVQRVLCCLATLLLAMISSAMFYQPEDKEGNSANNPGSEVQLGTMRFSMTTLYTSTVGLIITVPPIILIVFLFKSRRPWKKKFSCCGCRKDQVDLSESKTELELSPANSECELHAAIDKDPMGVKYEQNLLPPWVLIVAWLLLMTIILACSFFLILYSMQWGKTVSEEWLASFVLSFFESIFIMDPIKVILLSTAFALCMRNPQGSPESNKLPIDVIKEQSTIHGCTEIDPTILPPDPIPKDLLEKARKKKREEALANRVFIELILYILFVFCVFCVSYGNRDARSYNLHNHVMNQLVNPPFRKYSRVYYGTQDESFTWNRLRTLDDIYAWLNGSMQDVLFPWNSLNGDVLAWTDRLFIKDQDNYRVGPVRIRQARMPRGKPHSIKADPSLTGPCITNQENLLGNQERSPAYSINEEEDGEYCWRWSPTPCSKEEKMLALTASAWIHRTTRQEKSFPVIGKFALYSGAGYVFDLNFNKQIITDIILQELRENEWLNIQTRAVFIEFTLYNVNVNLLTSVRLAAEIPEYGGVFTWSDVKPIRIYDHTGGLGALMLICQLIAVLTTLFFMVKVFKKLREMKCQFFREAWNVLDLLIVTLCSAAFIMYIIRRVLITKVMGNFSRNPKAFANFYEAVLCDDIYGWLLSAIVFLCTLRIMRILGYNKRILMIATVLQRAGPGLFSFSVLFGVIILAFMSTGYALFSANLESFMTLWESYVTILYLLMGKNVFKKMVVVSAILSRIYFFLLAVIVVFVFLTIFQAILNFTITEVHSDVGNAPVPYGVMNILHKFYASLVLDNRIVEQFKSWSASKTDDKPNVIAPEPPQPHKEKESTEMQKIFSVLREHFNTTMEDTKKLSLMASKSSSHLRGPQSPSRAISPRQVNIDAPSSQDDPVALIPLKRKKKKPTKASICVAGDALVEPRLKKSKFPCPPPILSSRSKNKTAPEQKEKFADFNPEEESTPKLPAPARSVWASGIKNSPM